MTPTPGAADRAPEVRQMFERLAPRYDLANRVLSLGLDQGWRRLALAELGPHQGRVFVDLCAGTLDLTLALTAGGAGHVHAVDFSRAMLDTGARRLPPGAPVTLIEADARALPLEDGLADGIICGFGLRNVPEVHKAIAECARVLKPGGALVVLDFFTPTTAPARLLQATYNRVVMPVVGGLITGYGEAYRYLAGSIDAFTSRAVFEELVAAQGLEVSGRDMFPPVASMVVGRRGEAPRG